MYMFTVPLFEAEIQTASICRKRRGLKFKGKTTKNFSLKLPTKLFTNDVVYVYSTGSTRKPNTYTYTVVQYRLVRRNSFIFLAITEFLQQKYVGSIRIQKGAHQKAQNV